LLSFVSALSFWSFAATPRAGGRKRFGGAGRRHKERVGDLAGGVKGSEAHGIPISAKFEIEDGKLQLSIYTTKGNDFIEVVADSKTGVISRAEKVTDAVDLKEATAQKTAMAKAKAPLLTATETAVNANAGSRAVSIVPELFIFDNRTSRRAGVFAKGSGHDVEKLSDELRGAGVRRDVVCSCDCRG
jgi:hypothetical protein